MGTSPSHNEPSYGSHNDVYYVSVQNVSGSSKPRHRVSRLREKYCLCLGQEPWYCQVRGCNGHYEATAH
eukprot:scaffold8034_cov764-Pinguiococcus_pyrenoidosus.AAC.1